MFIKLQFIYFFIFQLNLLQPISSSFSSSLSRSSFLSRLLKIESQECESNGLKGQCMFSFECMKNYGKPIGICIESIFVASCCYFNKTSNSIETQSNSIKPFTVHANKFKIKTKTKTNQNPSFDIEFLNQNLKSNLSINSLIVKPNETLISNSNLELTTNRNLVQSPYTNSVDFELQVQNFVNKSQNLSELNSNLNQKMLSNLSLIDYSSNSLSDELDLVTYLKSTSNGPNFVQTETSTISNLNNSFIDIQTTMKLIYLKDNLTTIKLSDDQLVSDLGSLLPTNADINTNQFETITTKSWPQTTRSILMENISTLNMSTTQLVERENNFQSTFTSPLTSTTQSSFTLQASTLNKFTNFTNTKFTSASSQVLITKMPKSPVDIFFMERDCGMRPLKPKARVVGGRNAQFGEWPWQVLIKEATWLGLFVKTKCGGVLIDTKWVLTAAHCQPVFLGSLMVIVGEYDLNGNDEVLKPVVRSVKRMVIHRNYNPQTFENDIALLELTTPLGIQPHVIPICMPNHDEDFVGQIASVVGWGKLKYGGSVPKILQVVHLPILDNSKCQEMFLEAGYVKKIRESFLCAGYKHGGQDTCEGDSGGPLMVQRKNGQWVLLGTVSHGIKCAEPNLPGVYMRINAYKKWIYNVIHLPESNQSKRGIQKFRLN